MIQCKNAKYIPGNENRKFKSATVSVKHDKKEFETSVEVATKRGRAIVITLSDDARSKLIRELMLPGELAVGLRDDV